MLNAPITIQESQLAVATSLNHKAPGSDGNVQKKCTELLTLSLKHRVPSTCFLLWKYYQNKGKTMHNPQANVPAID